VADSASYIVPYRRRREGRTDYRLRRALIISGLPRLVVRASNKHMRVQFIQATVEGDHVFAEAFSKELSSKFKWEAPTGNVPSAYLTGLLAGHRAKAKGIAQAVLDVGLRRISRGSRIFAAMKGAVDSGIVVPHGEENLPSDERITGRHIAEQFKKLGQDGGALRGSFTRYLSKKLSPESIIEHFEQTRQRIVRESGK